MKNPAKGAEIAIINCLGYRPNESLLIITDNLHERIGRLFLKTAQRICKAELRYEVMKATGGHGKEPPERIAELMKKYDVVLLATRYSLSHTKARQAASRAGARIASMPGITLKSLASGGMLADYTEVRKMCNKMFKRIRKCKHILLTSPYGTNLEMKFGRHKWYEDTGYLRKRSDFGNLPAGEVDGSPNEGSSRGTLVFNYIEGAKGRVKLEIRNGFVVRCSDPKFNKLLSEKGRRNIAELGIGTNRKARDTKNMLEAEKILGTVHVALGNNTYYGGSCKVPFHQDGIISKPTLVADGKVLIRDGKWLI